MSDVQDETQDETIDVEEVVKEAKESFTLIDSIKNRAMRTRKLDLGYDEVNSEKLITIEATLGNLRNALENAEHNAGGVDELKKIAAKIKRDLKKANAEEAGALQEQLDEAQRQIDGRVELQEQMAPVREKLDELEAAAAEVRAEVAANSLSVELRALPYTIARGAARRARKHLGITEKGIPEDQQEDFEERQLIEIAYDQVVRYRDNRNGEEGTKLPVEVIEAMRDFLPISQSSKFFTTVNDLQFRNAISESAITQADF